nr:MAG TPA: hypothetical protein [Caudoviricetes sp.]
MIRLSSLRIVKQLSKIIKSLSKRKKRSKEDLKTVIFCVQ